MVINPSSFIHPATEAPTELSQGSCQPGAPPGALTSKTSPLSVPPLRSGGSVRRWFFRVCTGLSRRPSPCLVLLSRSNLSTAIRAFCILTAFSEPDHTSARLRIVVRPSQSNRMPRARKDWLFVRKEKLWDERRRPGISSLDESDGGSACPKLMT
jgi:hypothetical protein